MKEEDVDTVKIVENIVIIHDVKDYKENNIKITIASSGSKIPGK